MIFANELAAVTAEETQLEQLLQALRQKKSFFQQIQGKAQEHIQGLSWVVGHAKENLGTDALASLKTAVLTLFADGDGGNDDGGNQPTDPDTDPTPPLEFEISALDANGEKIEDGDKVEIINGGLNAGDIGTASVVGDNYLEVDIDQPSDPNQDTAGATYKHSQDVVKVGDTSVDTLFAPGSTIVDSLGSFGIVIGTNNIGMSVDWLGLGDCPNPASGKGIWYNWAKDNHALASLKRATHDRVKLLSTEEFLQFQCWDSDQLDEYWDNEWFDVGVGEKCKWGGATINRWIVVFTESCEWASPFASHLTCLLWEDTPLLGQHCSVPTGQNKNKGTNGGEAMPYVELVKVSDTIAYQRRHDGEIICTYIGFRTKVIAQSWKPFFEAITSSVELRQAKRLESCKWEIKAKGVSIKQIERFTKECDFSKNYQQQAETPAQAAGIEPPSGWGKPQPQESNLPPCPFSEGDLVDWKGCKLRVQKIGVEKLYCVLKSDPEGTKHHTTVPIAECSLVESVEPENLGEGDTCEVLEGRYKGQVGEVASVNRYSELPVSLTLPGGHIKGFLLSQLKLVSKSEKTQSRQGLHSGQVLLGNRVVTTGNYGGLGRRNAINNARNGLENKVAALELVKAGVSPEEALAAVTGSTTASDDYDF